jgi:acyl dehydratase
VKLSDGKAKMLRGGDIGATVFAERTFDLDDQERFAAVSGDRNPMHMDPVAARRSIAGFPVVHGIHVLLWALDSLFRKRPDLPPVAAMKVVFEKMIYVGARVSAVLVQHESQLVRVNVNNASGMAMMCLELILGDPRPSGGVDASELLFQPTEPLVPTFEQMLGCQGRVPFFSAADEVGHMFPAAARALTGLRVAGLACSTFLVGMVCPGLHSIYRGFNLATTIPNEGESDGLRFRVAHGDSRVRFLRMGVSGAGWTGSIEMFARPEPAKQPDLLSVAAKVTPIEFKGATALVIGGSRGLGEVIGKILVAGGADLILTYSVGEADARRVKAEIANYRGRCDLMRYNVGVSTNEQLSRLKRKPDQIYYMPTPKIFEQYSDIYDAKRFQTFFDVYVTGFYSVYQEIARIYGNDVSFFYPSSVSIDERPRNMTEYTMAKVAGEVLCADIQSFKKGRILVNRLPRLLTDQTASLSNVATLDPIDVLLPIVRAVHAKRAGTA